MTNMRFEHVSGTPLSPPARFRCVFAVFCAKLGTDFCNHQISTFAVVLLEFLHVPVWPSDPEKDPPVRFPGDLVASTKSSVRFAILAPFVVRPGAPFG